MFETFYYGNKARASKPQGLTLFISFQTLRLFMSSYTQGPYYLNNPITSIGRTLFAYVLLCPRKLISCFANV